MRHTSRNERLPGQPRKPCGRETTSSKEHEYYLRMPPRRVPPQRGVNALGFLTNSRLRGASEEDLTYSRRKSWQAEDSEGRMHREDRVRSVCIKNCGRTSTQYTPTSPRQKSNNELSDHGARSPERAKPRLSNSSHKQEPGTPQSEAPTERVSQVNRDNLSTSVTVVLQMQWQQAHRHLHKEKTGHKDEQRRQCSSIGQATRS